MCRYISCILTDIKYLMMTDCKLLPIFVLPSILISVVNNIGCWLGCKAPLLKSVIF